MLGQPPHFLVKQQNPEPITGIQKVEGEAAELSVVFLLNPKNEGNRLIK